MAKELTLRVITPEKVVVDTTADSVRFPALDGDMGVFPRHAGMVAALDAGLLRYKANGMEVDMFVSGGFAQVRANTVRVLVAASEKPEEIDVQRAREAEERARERIRAAATRGEGEAIDLLRAQASLHRAISRLRAANRR